MTPLVQGPALKALEETVATIVAFGLVTQHLRIIIELEGGQKWRIVSTTIGLRPSLIFLRSQIVSFDTERLVLLRDAR